MSKITKSVVKSFSRLRDNNTNRAALQGAFPDPSGALCACDGFMAARLYNAASAPELAGIPRPAADPLHIRIVDMLNAPAQQDYTLTASTARAAYHSSKPILSAKELRAFSRWSMREHGSDTFPVGGSFVSAARLALLLDVLPDACIFTRAGSPLDPVYLSGADGDAVLLPVRCTDPDRARARLDEYKASTAAPAPVPSAPAPAADPVQPAAPSADFVPASIRDAVENTPETPVKVIGYKSDGNTVCIHRVQAHHVADNVYVYATKANEYGRFMWQFVSLFACGYALKLDALQDSEHAKERPDSNYNRVTFHYCASFADDGVDCSLVDYVRMHNACFADDSAFLATVETEMQARRHVSLAFVRMLREMGNQEELIGRVMAYRIQREKDLQQEAEAREKARLEQEKQEEQQRQQEHEKALAACRETLLHNGERMPIDGAILCELAASLGVSVSLKLKGWIMNKLATVTIENGHMVMYQYNRQKKSEKGSNAFWPFMHALLDALHNQEQHAQAEEASEADLDHLFCREHTPKLENQGENLENDAYKRLLGLSSGTISTLMREKGLQDCDKYAAIDTFHHAIILAAQSLAPVEDETWQQLFERAYSALYPSTQHEEQEQPISQSETTSTQESAQKNTQGTSAQHAPELEKQPQNPSSDGHTLPDTWTRLEQLTMQQLLNTS